MHWKAGVKGSMSISVSYESIKNWLSKVDLTENGRFIDYSKMIA
jgi:hypothetical protein